MRGERWYSGEAAVCERRINMDSPFISPSWKCISLGNHLNGHHPIIQLKINPSGIQKDSTSSGTHWRERSMMNVAIFIRTPLWWARHLGNQQSAWPPTPTHLTIVTRRRSASTPPALHRHTADDSLVTSSFNPVQHQYRQEKDRLARLVARCDAVTHSIFAYDHCHKKRLNP